MSRKCLSLALACILCGCSGNYDREVSTLPLDMFLHIEKVTSSSIEVQMDNKSGYTRDFPDTYVLEKKEGDTYTTVKEGTYTSETYTLKDMEKVTFTIQDLSMEKGDYRLSVGDTSETFTY